MAVPEQIPVINYVADGIVKKFDVPFEYDQQSDLHVYVDGAEPTIDKYFFADNAFNFYIAPTSGQAVKIKRITPKERDTDYNLHTNTVRPKALNTDFDRLWYVLQEVFSDVGGLSQAVQDEIIARIQGDEDLLNQLTTEISARMLGDEAVTEDLKNYVNNMIALIIGDPSFNGIDADKVLDESGLSQQEWNNGVESIVELLAIQNPKDGSRVFVKSYHAGLGKGGGDFIYDSTKSTINDGVVVFNGWVRVVPNNIYSPYMSGCKCDGVTDDTTNFDNLQYYLEIKGIKATIDIDGALLINSELPRRGNTTYMLYSNTKYGMRLVSNVKYDLRKGSVLKFGNYFNDSQCILIWGGVVTSESDWLPTGVVDNFEFCGGGAIDMSDTGLQVSDHISPRMLFGCFSTPNSSIHDITIQGGDITNLVVTRRLSTNFHVYRCRFIDTYKDNSKSSDHTAIYFGGEYSYAYNNYFFLSSVKGRINSTAIEFHQSNQKAYNNTSIGYKTFVIYAAYHDNYVFDQNIPLSERVVTGCEAYNNYFEGVFFVAYWGDGKIQFGTLKTYNNYHKGIMAVTQAEFDAAGIPSQNQVSAFSLSQTPDSPNGETPEPTNVIDGAYEYGNTYVSSFDPIYTRDHHFYTLGTLKNNWIIYDNFVRCPQIANFQSDFNFNLWGFRYHDNIVRDLSAVLPAIFLEPISMVDCHIDIKFEASYTSSAIPVHIKIMGLLSESSRSIVNISAEIPDSRDKWVEGYEILGVSNFNTIKYNFPAVATMSVYVNSSAIYTYLLQSSDASLPTGIEKFDVVKSIPSRATTLVLPAVYGKTHNTWGSTVQGVAHTFGETETTDLTIKVYGLVTT